MPLVAAKCTQCGAVVNVDDSKDAEICPYCGTAFITQKAINNAANFNINASGNTINIYASESASSSSANPIPAKPKLSDEELQQKKKLLEEKEKELKELTAKFHRSFIIPSALMGVGIIAMACGKIHWSLYIVASILLGISGLVYLTAVPSGTKLYGLNVEIMTLRNEINGISMPIPMWNNLRPPY